MNDETLQILDRTDTSQLFRAEVVVGEAGNVVIALGREPLEHVQCDVLVAVNGPAAILTPGDVVLAWIPPGGERAVVLGRVAPSVPARPQLTETPDTCTIEAKHSLTLRVGDGSITIRADGKILIKGKDLVSHAKRLNRIRGGSVQIN